MQAATDPPGTESPAPPANGRAVASHAAGLVESVARLADLQVRLWLAEARSLVSRILLVVVFSLCAFILALVGAAFLYAGVFHFLTDYLRVPTAWALLIFAGVHGLAAGVLVVLAIRILKRSPAASSSGKKT